MNPQTVKDTYRRMIDDGGEPIFVRRYTGSGTVKPKFDAQVRAKVSGYAPDELVGGIVQGDRRVIILVQDLIDRQFAMPILASDKVVVRGKELAIIAPDDSTRRISGVLIAYELTARG
jgi:hypothetical protein